jgi:tripartite-type tricarboxylate transporter receptor subunit TctC
MHDNDSPGGLEMNRRDILRLGLAASAASVAAPHVAPAQAYPSRPIRLVVPFSAGGVNDVVGRLWADKVKDTLGTVFVDNKGGAAGTIGTSDVQRADPDGHTVLLGSTSTMVLTPATMAKISYSSKDFIPIGVLCLSSTSITVHPSTPAKTLPELIAYAKANPGKLSYGSAGNGTMSHLGGELFKQLTNTDIVHVPYRGAGPGLQDLIAGQIPMMSPNITGPVIEQHKAGKLRILAVASTERIAGLSDVPTGIEQGLKDYVAQLFLGIFVRIGTPQPMIDKLVAVNNQALADKTFQDALEKSGFEPSKPSTPEAARRYLDEELARWTPIAKTIGLEPT